jgi:hypothetical protein
MVETSDLIDRLEEELHAWTAHLSKFKAEREAQKDRTQADSRLCAAHRLSSLSVRMDDHNTRGLVLYKRGGPLEFEHPPRLEDAYPNPL